ncbi:MAG: helix-turn-helix domain-containing protein [Candidatus Ornithospirochaeta sp.]
MKKDEGKKRIRKKTEVNVTIGERIAGERKKKGMTQEDLAAAIGVSRQAISKWEGDISLPDTDNLMRLSLSLSSSLDYILSGKVEEKEEMKEENEEKTEEIPLGRMRLKMKMKEKHSEKTLCGLPLWSIGVKAKGFFALGFKSEGVFSLGFSSKGVFSLGCFSLGGVSIGMASLGLLSLGTFSLGLFSIGAISIALVAGIGSISIAPLSLGALSFGEVSVGAFSRGRYFSYGDNAKGLVAIAKSKVAGEYTAILPLDGGKGEYLFSVLSERIPRYLRWTLSSVRHLFGL